MADSFADVYQTHSAVVFFVADHAYKLKKPVNLGFLDFSTPRAREAACRREVELNRRFAPDVYLGVADVRDPGGRVCDHLVQMRRMPSDRRLSTLVQAGEPVETALRQVARMLAAAHARAGTGPGISEQGGRDALSRRWDDNIGVLRTAGADLVGEPEVDTIDRLAGAFLAGRGPLFDARISDGRIVDGHGDLLADDIFCLDDGPRVLDCLEFDDRLRWLDGLDDAAFLAMDLERLGAPDLAERFSRWYAEYSGDQAPASLRHHYVAYRAGVRAKVSCIRARQGDQRSAGDARSLAGTAIRHLRAGAVTFALVGGLPGTGKSWLAGAVADRLGFVVLNSDRIRKELAGIPPRQDASAPYGTGLYTDSWTERTYAELCRRAGDLLAMGESVIADATWASAGHREAAAKVARRTSSGLVRLRCTAAPELAASRMASRTGSASDAGPDIAAEIAVRQVPWPEAVVIDTGGETAEATGQPEAVRRALEAIRPHGADHVWRPLRPYMLPG